MVAEKKYKRVLDIPLKREVTQNEYMTIYRSKDPLKKAIEMNLADERKLLKLMKKINWLLLGMLYALLIT